MLSAKGANYFPFVCLMDSEGEVLTEFRPTSEEALNSALELGRTYLGFREKAATDPVAKASLGVLDAFKSKEPPAFSALKEMLAKSGLEKSHPAVVKKGLAKVSETYYQNVMRKAQKQMRAASTADDSQAKFKAIEAERCAQVLKLHHEGVKFDGGGIAFSFYSDAAKGAAAKKDGKLAMDLISRAEKPYQMILKQYDGVIAKSEGRRKAFYEKRKAQLVSMFEGVMKTVKAAQ